MKRLSFTAATVGAVLAAACAAWGTTQDGTICTTCEDPLHGVSMCNDGLAGPEAFSPNSVRYLDGVAVVSVGGMGFPYDDSGWTFRLTYLNRVTPEDAGAVVDEDAGYNWVTNVPRLEVRRTGELWLQAGAMTQVRFQRYYGQGPWKSYTGVYASIEKEGGYYILGGVRGGTARFHTTAALDGKPYQVQSPAGRTWTYAYYPSGRGRYSYKLEQILGPDEGSAMQFSYRLSDGRLAKVEVVKGSHTVATMHLAYYESYWAGKGRQGELRCVSVVEGGRSPRTTYFRYYTATGTDGRTHDLKYVIGPESFAALDDKYGFPEDGDRPGIPIEGWVEQCADSEIDDDAQGIHYFDQRFSYYTSGAQKAGRVKKEVVRTGGCGCVSGPTSVGTWEYDYDVAARPALGNFNARYVKVRVKKPDGHWKYLELNRMGAALVVVDVDGQVTSKRWAQLYEYDDEGLLLKAYHPSACDTSGFTWTNWGSWPSGTVGKQPKSGIVEAYEYQKWSEEGNRKYSGKLKKKSLEIGATAVESRTILERTYAWDQGKLMYPATEVVYPVQGSDALTKSYAYSWYEDGDLLSARTTFYHALGQTQTVLTSTLEEYYTPGNVNQGPGISGRLWRHTEGRDPSGGGGRVTLYTYEFVASGDPVVYTYKETRRVDPDGLGLKEETWSDVAGNLTHRFRYEKVEGSYRALETERWLYAKLSKGSSGSKGQGGDGLYPRDVTIAYEHVLEDDEGDVSARDGVARIEVRNLDGRLIEEAVGRTSETGDPLAEDFDSSQSTLETAFRGELFERVTSRYDGAALLERARWTDAEDPQAPRHVTEYKYDAAGRLYEETNAAGTIRRYSRDALGRVEEVNVGVSELDLVSVENRLYDGGQSGGDGLLTWLEGPVGDGVPSRETVFAYDPWGREVFRASVVGEVDEVKYWAAEERTYDNLDRVVGAATYLAEVEVDQWKRVTSKSRFYDDAFAGALWQRETSFEYDDLGREWKRTERWREVGAGGALGDPGAAYVTRTWHDRLSRVVKIQPPGVLFEKRSYDAAGRVTAGYRSFDTDEGETLEEASSVAGDVVLEEEGYQYDALGREVFRVRYERKAGETGWSSEHYGALSALSPGYRTRSCSGSWYSASGRLSAAVDFGESALVARPEGVPPRTDAELVTEYGEGWGRLAGGVAIYPGQPSEPRKTRWEKVTDAAETVSYRIFDNLGRLVREIRDHGEGGEPGTKTKGGVTVQRNVTTSFDYDGLDRVVRAVAHEYREGGSGEWELEEEVTAYEYGVRREGSLQSSALDTNDLLWRVLEGRGTGGGEEFSRQTVYAYDRQGAVVGKGAGQYWPAAFRTWHGYGRDLLGRLRVDEVSAPGGGVDLAIDEIGWRYDSHGRLRGVFSNPGEGEWPEEFANAVVFAYDGCGNLVSETQDHGDGWSKTVNYSYEADSGYPVPRLSGITYPSGRTVAYARVKGSEDWSRKDWAVGRVSRIGDEGEGLPGYAFYEEYEGLGRALKISYDDDGDPAGALVETYVTADTANSPPTSLGLDRFGRVARLYARSSAGSAAVDYRYSYDREHAPVGREDEGPVSRGEAFFYDDVERLVRFERESEAARVWELTAAGNWDAVRDGGTTTDDRWHNERNEITGRPVGGGVPEYDLEGNTTGVPLDTAGWSFWCVYDGWNRLVEVKGSPSGPTLARYERDGLGRIAVESQGGRHGYWDAAWRLVSVYSGAAPGEVQREYLWGVRYVDEILATHVGTAGTVRWHVQDANWNVVGTLDEGGVVREFVTYDPYGMPTFWDPSGGGWVPTTRKTSNYGAEHLFQGRWWWSFQYGSGEYYLRLYDFRHRTYAPKLGRFLERDPLGAWGDATARGNAYALESGVPTRRDDPTGTEAESPKPSVLGASGAFAHPHELYEKVAKLTDVNWDVDWDARYLGGGLACDTKYLSEHNECCKCKDCCQVLEYEWTIAGPGAYAPWNWGVWQTRKWYVYYVSIVRKCEKNRNKFLNFKTDEWCQRNYGGLQGGGVYFRRKRVEDAWRGWELCSRLTRGDEGGPGGSDQFQALLGQAAKKAFEAGVGAASSAAGSALLELLKDLVGLQK